jgi:hypothetical protein
MPEKPSLMEKVSRGATPYLGSARPPCHTLKTAVWDQMKMKCPYFTGCPHFTGLLLSGFALLDLSEKSRQFTPFLSEK